MADPRRPRLTEASEPSDHELDVFALFTDLLSAGQDPDVDEFLLRFPGCEQRLRASLEGAKLFHDEVARVRQERPDFRAWHLLRPPAG